MKKRYTLEVFEQYDDLTIYTLKYDDERLSETEKFFLKFPPGCPYDEDVDRIVAAVDNIIARGAKERFFRPEGSYGDGVGALPIEFGNKVRLYFLRITDNILIVGNGDVKDAARWQDSPKLAPIVTQLIETSKFIHARINNGTLRAVHNILTGNLKFTRDDEKQCSRGSADNGVPGDTSPS
jgi:hypothetical protein